MLRIPLTKDGPGKPVPFTENLPGLPDNMSPVGDGSPLGLEIDPRDGSLLVCDAYRGLLRVADNGDIEVLADSWDGRRLRFPNNAAVAADGTVYFSDSSTRFRVENYVHDVLEHRATGRIFRYRPGSGRLELVVDGLHFPNAVALATGWPCPAHGCPGSTG